MSFVNALANVCEAVGADAREVVLGHLHGGLYLAALVAGLLTLGGVLFARRDLQ